MASEYGSWPVEPAAHQILMLFRLARAFNISGMIVSRKCSNGTLSRKKKVLVGGHGFDHLGDDR
jgi:hypothetical protein